MRAHHTQGSGCRGARDTLIIITMLHRPTIAPTTGGREGAAPPPRPDNLRIPPHEGLEAWESGTARSRGHNLTNLTAHYPGDDARSHPAART